ncbi:MAG: DHA2 family efflux MFS transporter permease subunit [Phycisphaerales bacterium]|nr:DHA2 family efflux MFS transporter permease subunit [Phycisphaerales bacterium]
MTISTPHPKRALALVAMTGSLSMIMLDVTVMGVALPTLRESLNMSATQTQWAVNGYVLALASSVALLGKFGDVIGRTRAFLIGVVVFAMASAMTGAATSAETLILWRVVQGLGAACMQPASAAMVTSLYRDGERGRAMGIYVGISMAFLAIGPVLGGLIVQWLSWRWCFYLNLPIAAAAIALTLIAKPPKFPRQTLSIDLVGAALLLLGLPTFVAGVQLVSSRGWNDALVVPMVLGGGALATMFVFWELRHATPLIRVGLLRDRGFLSDALVLLVIQFAMTGLIIQQSLYAQTVLGYSPSRAGASLMPMMIPILLIVPRAGKLYDKVGVRMPSIAGLAIASLGMATMTLGLWLRMYPVLAIGMALFGAGIGLTMSPTNTDALSRVSIEQRGEASGVIQTFRQVGGTTGLAVLMTVSTIAMQTCPLPSEIAANQELSTLVVAAAQGDDQALDAITNYGALTAPAKASVHDLMVRGTTISGVVATGCCLLALGIACLWSQPPARRDEPV